VIRGATELAALSRKLVGIPPDVIRKNGISDHLVVVGESNKVLTRVNEVSPNGLFICRNGAPSALVRVVTIDAAKYRVYDANVLAVSFSWKCKRTLARLHAWSTPIRNPYHGKGFYWDLAYYPPSTKEEGLEWEILWRQFHGIDR
jgi:hypothetical protein